MLCRAWGPVALSPLSLRWGTKVLGGHLPWTRGLCKTPDAGSKAGLGLICVQGAFTSAQPQPCSQKIPSHLDVLKVVFSKTLRLLNHGLLSTARA